MSDKAQQIREFLVTQLRTTADASGIEVGDFADDFNLLESGLVDSINLLDLLATVEREFGLSIDFGAVGPDEFSHLGRLVEALARS